MAPNFLLYEAYLTLFLQKICCYPWIGKISVKLFWKGHMVTVKKLVV